MREYRATIWCRMPAAPWLRSGSRDGTPPTVASDLFACGCVWWHILCGRPPLGGGDTLARLRAAQAAAIDDLQQWAADVPGRAGRGHSRLFAERPAATSQVDGRLDPAAWTAPPPRSPGNRPLPGRRRPTSRPLVAIKESSRQKTGSSSSAHDCRSGPGGCRGCGLADCGLHTIVRGRSRLAWSIPTRSVSEVMSRHHCRTQRAVVDQNGKRYSTAPREPSPRPIVDTAITPAGYSDRISTDGLAIRPDDARRRQIFACPRIGRFAASC